MGPLLRTGLITGALASTAMVGYNLHAARSTDTWADLGAFVTDELVAAGGVAIAAASGLVALHAPWRGVATLGAGVGLGVAASAVAGFAALKLADKLG